jgi:hypothetical protein
MGRSYINEDSVEAGHRALRPGKVSEKLQVPKAVGEVV